jgi:glyoxylase-like metal-dependent hydrolase (beta-lactamase superfamily II)
MRINDALALVGSLQFGISGPLDCHVYAVRGPEGIVLIDAGAGTHTEQLLRNVSTDFPDAAVKALLVTHCHIDHFGGAAQIRELTACKVIAPALCRKTIETADEEASGFRAAREQSVYPSDLRLRPCPVDLAVGDGESFTAAGIAFTAIHVRGHSRDSHCYLMKHSGGNWLFTGDVVFYGGVLGVINAEGSGMEGYRSDLTKLSGLKVDGLFPGHGLFTLARGQRHLDRAMEQTRSGFVGRQIGQGDLIF